MKPRPWSVPVLGVAFLAALAGCGTLGKHYDEDLSQAPATPARDASVTGRISVESRPAGAMITINDAQSGTAPVSVAVELDASGAFLDGIEITADFSVVNPVRGVSHVVTARFRRGEPAPKLLILARAADGGIQSLGNVLIQK